MSKDFAKLVLLANLISWPVAYFSVDHWLQGFAYRVEVGIVPFVVSAGMALAVALATVSYQAWKAASLNPADVLRGE